MPKSSKSQEKRTTYYENHRKSNHFFGKDKKNEEPKSTSNPHNNYLSVGNNNGVSITGSNNFHSQNQDKGKKFHDLRMYLKVPRKKEFYSEAKRKKDDRQRVHSVYYEPKK